MKTHLDPTPADLPSTDSVQGEVRLNDAPLPPIPPLPPLKKLLPDLPDADRWMQVVYGETWKQLAHQDQLAAARSNVFIAVQAALLAVVAALSISVVRIGCLEFRSFEHQVHLGLLLSGVLWVLIGTVLFILARYFVRVTRAAQNYVELHRVQLRAIEAITVENLGPAIQARKWRDHSEHSKEKFFVYSNPEDHDDPRIREIEKASVDPYVHFGNFKYLNSVVRIWRDVYALLILVGLLAAIIGSSPSNLSTRFNVEIKDLRCEP